MATSNTLMAVTSELNSKAITDVYLSEVSGVPLLALKCLRAQLGDENFLFVLFILGGMDVRFPKPDRLRRIIEQSVEIEAAIHEEEYEEALSTREARKVLQKLQVGSTKQTFCVKIPVRFAQKKRKRAKVLQTPETPQIVGM